MTLIEIAAGTTFGVTVGNIISEGSRALSGKNSSSTSKTTQSNRTWLSGSTLRPGGISHNRMVVGVAAAVAVYQQQQTLDILKVEGTDLPNQGEVNGDVKDAPPVDAGKQGKHVPGHNNNDSSKSQWPEGETGVNETQEAWQNGIALPDGTKVWDAEREVGINGETGVRVHIDKRGNIHGYPVNPNRYFN